MNDNSFGLPANAFLRHREKTTPKPPAPKKKLLKPVRVEPELKAIVVPDERRLRAIYPKAPVITAKGKPARVFPFTLDYARQLYRLGYDVPSPIKYEYDWTGSTPFEIQRVTASMLTMEPRAFVLSGMGTGKTRCVLWAWDFLHSIGHAKKLLVLSPLSTLKFVWLREIFASVRHHKAVVLHGTRVERRVRLDDKDANIFIVNHDGIKIIKPRVAKMIMSGEIDTIVIDELAAFRNQSKRWRSLEHLCKIQGVRVWGLTGTPMPRSPVDVWAQVRLITPQHVPSKSNDFRDALMYRVAEQTYEPKPDAVDKAFRVMQPAVRFSLEDVVELPPVIRRDVDISLGSKQARAYEELSKLCHTMIENDEITTSNAGVAINKLLQLSLGWIYTAEGKAIQLDNSERLDMMLELVRESSRKVLVFAPFRHALAGVTTSLAKAGVEHAVMHGGTPLKERSEIFSVFQNTDKYHVLAAHPQCLAHGVTLTRANTIIWLGPILSLETYDQANHRITRVGQKHKQLIYRLRATPVEKRMYRLLDTKHTRQADLLAMFAKATAEKV